ncbi:SDR family oxidoreductase [Streptomyces sp. NRRL WC-3725]|uniref:SDR family oxidoreductase n=1 Tax=Streptomyces sp. NRRL WC-3725 TaxID=1463933 RepID=UPI001902BB9A|nr:SDR family oxidoreductase [Streptomyces sp. NRRL WC-3725]
MNDAANTAGSGNASAPATTKAAPKNPWALPDVSYLMVGVLGGTGDQGRGLACGAIVNVSSINARLPFPMVVDYSAHKAALTNLTTTLSEEFAPRGVRVNAVSPGPVRTPGWTDEGRLADGKAAASGTTREQVLTEGVPASMGIALGRMGEADEIAAAVAFLLGPEARWITGTDLVVDGGTIKAA